MSAIHLSLAPLVQTLTHEQFYKLCMANKGMAMERSATGELILCPDFVIELRSESDRLKPLPQKMQEYLASGLQLKRHSQD